MCEGAPALCERREASTPAPPRLGGGGRLCSVDSQEVTKALVNSLLTRKKKKGRIKDERTSRDACTAGSGVILLENVSRALFVVAGGERKHPKPIWLSECVPRRKSSLCLRARSLFREAKCRFQDVCRFHTQQLLFVNVSIRASARGSPPR